MLFDHEEMIGFAEVEEAIGVVQFGLLKGTDLFEIEVVVAIELFSTGDVDGIEQFDAVVLFGYTVAWGAIAPADTAPAAITMEATFILCVCVCAETSVLESNEGQEDEGRREEERREERRQRGKPNIHIFPLFCSDIDIFADLPVGNGVLHCCQTKVINEQEQEKYPAHEALRWRYGCVKDEGEWRSMGVVISIVVHWLERFLALAVELTLGDNRPGLHSMPVETT